MANYLTTLEIPCTIAETFAFVSDFRNAPSWDPQTLEAYKISDGPIGLGTRFLLVGVFLGKFFGGQKMLLPYEIVAFEPPHLLALEGETTSMRYHDRIELSARGSSHTQLTYDATLDLQGWLGRVNDLVERVLPGRKNPIFKHAFQLVGDRATERMPRAVADGAPRSTSTN